MQMYGHGVTLQKRAVVVTGLGIVSSLGNDIASFWEACLRGRTKVSLIPEAWRHYYSPKSSHWSPLEPPDYASRGIRRSDLLSYDAAALNAMYAADDAFNQSGCTKSLVEERTGRYLIGEFETFRCGVFIGTGLGCITSAFENYIAHLLGRLNPHLLANRSFAKDLHFANELATNINENRRVLPIASTKSMANSISALLSIRYGFQGPNETCVAACAAGTSAIARAYEQISSGRLDFALAGGSEFYGDRAGGVFMAFDRLNTLAKARDTDNEVNRPFDRDRTGFLFSQGGSCVLALEELGSARARRATILATIKGTYSTSDGYSLAALAPNGDAIRSMIRRTLDDAGVATDDIDYVNTHGTGTTQNDELEAAILESEFPSRPFISSTKSLLGHTIGACGAIETAVVILGILTGELHPSINLKFPIRDLNFVLKRTSAEIANGFTHNFGFGGHNVGLVIGKG